MFRMAGLNCFEEGGAMDENQGFAASRGVGDDQKDDAAVDAHSDLSLGTGIF
jgi:hypothetical protein